MLKKVLFTFSSVVIVLALAGCDGNSQPALDPADAAPLDEGIEAFKPPEPGTIPAVERPGAAHSKTTSGG